jgi:Fe-Mn family superoxide dismutase
MKNEIEPTIVGDYDSELLALTDLNIPSSEKLTTKNSTINSSPDLIGKFTLPVLPYAYDALEPYIDKMTMEIHHAKHHAAYVTNLNKALNELKNVPSSLEEIIKNIGKNNYPIAVRNNGGGHYNHTMFWKLMKFNGGGQPTGNLLESINNSFGSFDKFKIQFTESATKVFGSGWTWLVVNKGQLEIGVTPNQDNPLMDFSSFKGYPILCLDLWEHAYYLKYQNRRVDYINGWWNVLNWEEVSHNLKNANNLEH